MCKIASIYQTWMMRQSARSMPLCWRPLFWACLAQVLARWLAFGSSEGTPLTVIPGDLQQLFGSTSGARPPIPERASTQDGVGLPLPKIVSQRSFWQPSPLTMHFSGQGTRSSLTKESQIVEKLEALGAKIFKDGERVVEVKLDRTRVADEDLRLVAELHDVTDLSLEQSQIGDAGLTYLKSMPKLEWLNLFSTQVSDAGLGELKTIATLKHLPLGHTKVTDAGLIHLGSMPQLIYVGLRGDNISDAGLKHLRTLKNLTGLHLGETRITDEGVQYLKGLTQLQRLWLHNTPISDRAIVFLLNLKELKELHIYDTQISNQGIRNLQSALPSCHIVSQR